MPDDDLTSAQQQLIEFSDAHPDLAAWTSMDDDAATSAFAELLYGGVGDTAIRDRTAQYADALVVYVRRLVDEVGTGRILAAISLVDEGVLRTKLAHYKIPYQKDRDEAWLNKVVRRIAGPYDALCLNAVVALAAHEPYRDLFHSVLAAEKHDHDHDHDPAPGARDAQGGSADGLGEPPDVDVGAALETIVVTAELPHAWAVSLLAAAVDHQLWVNGFGTRGLDDLFVESLTVSGALLDSPFVDALENAFVARVADVDTDMGPVDMFCETLAGTGDDDDFVALAHLVAELVESRATTGLYVPRVVLDADDPASAVDAAMADVNERLGEIARSFHRRVVMSLVVARELGVDGDPPRNFDEIVAARTEVDHVDEIVSDLCRLRGPESVAGHIAAVRQLARDLADARQPPPDDLIALHGLVTGTRDLALTETFATANREMAVLGTVAYAGELTVEALPEPDGDRGAPLEDATDNAEASVVSDRPTRPTDASRDGQAAGRKDPTRAALTGVLASLTHRSTLPVPDPLADLAFDAGVSRTGPRWTGATLPNVPRPDPQRTEITEPGDASEPGDAMDPAADGSPTEPATDVSDTGREGGQETTALPEPLDPAPATNDAPTPAHRAASPAADPAVEDNDEDEVPDKGAAPLGGGTPARAVFVGAVSAGRYGAAHHIAAAAGAPEADLWRFAALAAAIATGTGPVAGAINTAVDAITEGTDIAASGDERGPVEVAYLAAVRAALVAPHTTAIAALTAASSSLPALEAFTDAVVLIARQGIALIDHVLTQAADLADAERRVADAAEAAATWQARTATRSVKYHRATEVLRIVVADNGPIGALCVVAAGDHPNGKARRGAAEEVLAAVAELRDESAAFDAFDAAHAKAFEIHSGARDRLLAFWNEGLDVAADWARSVINLDAARDADGDAWQAGFLRRLQDAHTANADDLDALVADLRADPSDRVRAAGDACAQLLESIRALLVGERPDQVLDQPDAVLNMDLLAVPGYRLGADWKLAEVGDLTDPAVLDRLADAVVAGPDAALRAAFDACVLAEDHVGTGLCIEALTRAGADDVDDLASTDATTADAARAAVSSLWRETEDLLAADARLGYLVETTRRAWTADLYAADPSGRNDIGACRATIDAIRDRSARNRADRTEEIRAEISAAAEAEPAVAAATARILGRVDAGDLATAWEYVSLAREGAAIPEPPEPLIDVGEFFPDRDRELAEAVNLSTRAAANAAAKGQRAGPLDFSGLSDADRTAAKDGLDAWRAMSNVTRPGKEYTEWASHLSKVLAALGLTAATFERSPLTGAKEHDRLWIDLGGITTTGDPVVPAFAPDPGGRRVMRVLAITGGPDAGQLEAAVDRDRSGDPVLVLHHGPLGPDLRAAIAERFRAVGRAVSVVDDDLFAHLVQTGARRYERTMGLVLPFTTTNPYHLDVSGLVPETMFFGRRAERDAIMDRYGTSHLYGGRQLGKSALLRHVERAFNATPNQVAIYVDLKGAQIGMPRPPEAVFDILWGPLVNHGIVEGDLPAANVPDVVAAAIDAWLGSRPGRRLLVLLDECDNFLKADSDRDLATSARLKNLMERTDRACKFVFAGLHTVQRFSSVANTPMAHLGTPIAIGPLEGSAAADLITKPLHALGYRFSDPELVNRILAHTSRHPALLVIFCHHLLRKLQSRRRLSGEPPFKITEADVDGTWSDPEVSAAIRERVQWTLALDPAYEVITYVIAHLASTEGGSADHRIPVRDLQAECTYWWPAGFDGYLPEQFRLLADELIGLGVLAREGSRYGLRNPNVARLLGTDDEIETVLAGANLKQPEQTFEPATWRRPVQGADGKTFRSPLSHEQLDRLTAPTVGATIVAGTRASGIDRVGETLAATVAGRTKVTTRTWHDPIEPMLRPVGEDRHRIAVIDMRGAPGPNAAEVLAGVAEAVDPDRPRTGSRGTWSVILVVDAVADGAVLRHALTLPTLGTVAVQRWTPAAISAFGRDAGFPFAGDDGAAAVAETTGGWGYLVDRVASAVAGATTLSAVLDNADSGQLPARIGFDDDPVVAAAFDVAAGLVTGPEDGCDLQTLAAFLDESPAVVEALRISTERHHLPDGATGANVAEQLVLAALLDAGPGGNVWVEPVVAAAFADR